MAQLVDIRTVPRSRHNSQYAQVALVKSLEVNGIACVYMKGLGSLRSRAKASINWGWRLGPFRNYADYMQTE